MSIKSQLYRKENFLGLDLGEKTLGISFSQFGIIAKNLKTIKFERHQYHQLIPPLSKIITELNINTIIWAPKRPKYRVISPITSAINTVRLRTVLEWKLSRITAVLKSG
ncbi:MAG: hypothetical protein Q8764_02675, partial [Pigeon pea little leaf phytoplasma]|nr:hypothetical protein ['Bituminaria bituminosa' little leaf phytoplasma]MDV3161763.1 hypothetical protein [Pigeon pea little leaf phytoplasma]MDV3163609.1 hypothetical protein [Pigeon pea little leaf phytoplasma]MDV3189256.1 hypothetical protein [Pigeon pea little leaf phytoplasma]MDV3196869.1 hypothetical protein [Pigeon pea little leaf phytoplasma]